MLVEPAQFPEPAAEGVELLEGVLDRLGHQIEGDVVDGTEKGTVDGPGGATGRGGDPALTEGHTQQRVLLGHVVELVPLVVGAVLCGVGDLGEGEEAHLHLVHDDPLMTTRYA